MLISVLETKEKKGICLIKLYRQTLPKVSINLVQGLGLTNYIIYHFLFPPEKKYNMRVQMDRQKKEKKGRREEGRKKISSGKLDLIIFHDKVCRYFPLTVEHRAYRKLHIFITDNICSDAS